MTLWLAAAAALCADGARAAGKLAPPAAGRERWVAPDGAEGNDGTRAAPWSLFRANRDATPGDIFHLLDGVYRDVIRPARGGEAGAPIVYRAENPLGAVFADVEIPIVLSNRSHVVIEGVRASGGVRKFLEAIEVEHLTLRGCRFENATGAKAALIYSAGGPVRVSDCEFDAAGDLLFVAGGTGHLIERNTFGAARHTGLVLMGVERSVVRQNTFRNPWQKTMEVFTMSNSAINRFAPGRLAQDRERRTRHLLIEGNRFELARGQAGCSGIQYAGNQSIIRRNVFASCGVGIDLTGYSGGRPEACFNRANRIYHNVIYDCGRPDDQTPGPGVLLSHEPGLDFGDQVFVNNIIAGNRLYPGDVKPRYPRGVPRSIQISFLSADPGEARFAFNNLFGQEAGDPVFWIERGTLRSATVKAFEKLYPDAAADNLSVAPGFVDAAAGDFRLAPGSACIDAGGPLTRARSAGEGTEVEVEDALFLCDGFGLIDGDVVRIGTQRVTVRSVDYERRVVRIDRPIRWDAGTPISADYAGSAPDLGAFERGMGEPAER